MFNRIIPVPAAEERPLERAEAEAGSLDMVQLYDQTAAGWFRDDPQVRDDLITWPLLLTLARKYGRERVILDCGCGTGNICRLVSPFAKNVVGIDISQQMILEAEKHTPPGSKTTYIKGDMTQLTDHISPRSIDLCLSIFGYCCMKNLPELKAAIKQMRTVLTDSGAAIIQIPHPLEGFFKQPSQWVQEVDAPESYFKVGVPLRRRLRTVDGKWLVVARHHFTLSNYMEAILEAGFRIMQVLEPAPTASVLESHPSLAREARLPSSMFFILEC